MRLWNLYRKGIISADKTLEVYSGLYHEAFKEPKRELVFRDVDPWIENNPTAGLSFKRKIMKNVFKTPIHVRFQDIDRAGHVHNALFFTYFTEARLAFFEKLIVDTAFTSFPSIMAHTSCDFLRPIMLNTWLSVGVWVKEIGTKSFKLGYQLADESDESISYSKAESVQVCFDYKENKSIVIPEELRKKLIEYQ